VASFSLLVIFAKDSDGYYLFIPMMTGYSSRSTNDVIWWQVFDGWLPCWAGGMLEFNIFF